MIEKKDLLEEMLNEEFARLAKEEENAVQKEDIGMLEEVEGDIYTGIQEKIQEMEREKQKDYLYAQLSEEDLRALELGRKIMEREAREERDGKIIRKKKRIRMFIGLAAALVMAMGVGVTSMGGPERIIQMMKRAVGDREVTQIDSNEDNLKIIEAEEKAYQKVNETFGIEPVRIRYKAKKMKFEKMEFDKELQIVELYYEYEEEMIAYLINASYEDMSWGVDVEDEIVKSYDEEIKGCNIQIKVYNISPTDEKKYSASFKYKGLEYYLIGVMNEEVFYNILNNLFF
ncbi:hypothetical protein C817_03016 [Dorea sp. 5-2]|nr:hypothetical protein C817_03016 [Dorea sp. 5-2]